MVRTSADRKFWHFFRANLGLRMPTKRTWGLRPSAWASKLAIFETHETAKIAPNGQKWPVWAQNGLF